MSSAKTEGESGAAVSKAELERQERSARRFWVTLIVGFLGLQVAGGVFAVYLAVSDSTVAIIPNYYSTAVNWDVTRRARELTQDLGWQIEILAGLPIDAETGRPLEVRINTRNAQPVTGIIVSAKLFHHARGRDIYQLKLDEVTPGVFRGITTLTQAGMWQVDLQFEGDHGIAAVSRELIVE